MLKVQLRGTLLGTLLGLWGLCAAVGSAAAADPFILTTETSQFTSSFALRYWYGLGSTSKDLYGFSRDELVSRLSYTGMQSHSLEMFTRVDHSSGLFWKGYAGGGLLTQGNLQDEDFPPVITPYSSTNSTLQNQSLGYISFRFRRRVVARLRFPPRWLCRLPLFALADESLRVPTDRNQS